MATDLRRSFRGIGVALSLLLFIGLAEVAARLLYSYVVSQNGRGAVELMLSGRPPIGQISPHPYMLYVNTPNFASDGYHQHNSLGYRGDELRSRHKGALRVLALGGSTTYGFLLPNPQDAWPAQLERELRRSGVDVEVVNGGLNYGTSAELLSHWVFRDRYLKPDIVIVHGPGNDISPLLFDEYDAEYVTFRRGWGAVSFGRRPGERFLLKSALARVGYGWWLGAGTYQINFWQPRPWSQITGAEALANVNYHEPVAFERNLELLLRTIEADGALAVDFDFVLAPKEVYQRPVTPLPADARYLEHVYDAMLKGHAKESAVVQTVTSRLGVPLFRIPAGELPLGDFLDHCHLDAAGEAIEARFLAAALQPTLAAAKHRSTSRDSND